MAVSSTVRVTVTFTGDIDISYETETAINASSPGERTIATLSTGPNTITPPAGGSTPKGVLIIPPAGNTTPITAKGISGDTGVVLHPTNPTFLSLNSGVTDIVLYVPADVIGVVLVWS